MKNDPIIEEIHQGRREHAGKFGFDLKKIVADLRARQAQSGHPIVRRAPKRITPDRSGSSDAHGASERNATQ